MALIAYPSDLPAPQRWIGVPRERRARSDLPGFTQHRKRSLDQVQDIVEAQWTYEPEQMQTWRDWYRDELLRGQRRFAISVAGAGGWIDRVARYRTGTVKEVYLGFGIWRVTAQLEIRGRSELPEGAVAPSQPILWDDAASFGGWEVTEDGKTASLSTSNAFPYPARNLFGDRYVAGGKQYFEITVGSDDSSAVMPGYIGFISSSGRVHSIQYNGYVLEREGLIVVNDPNNANVLGNVPYLGGPPAWGSASTIAAPVTLMFAINFATGEGWVGMHGNWYNADPAAGTLPLWDNIVGPITPYVAYFANNPDVVVTLRTEAGEMQWGPPDGFSAGGGLADTDDEPEGDPPPDPTPPDPGDYATPRVVGLDYTQDYSASNVALLAPYPVLIRSFSTGNAAGQGTAYPNALHAINPDLQLAQYVILNELADPVASGQDYYPLWHEVTSRNWWARFEPGSWLVQWTDVYNKYELNMTAAVTPNGAGQRLPQFKAQEFDFPTRFDNIPDASWVFIDNFWRQPRVTADYNRDGVNDTPANAGQIWRTGFVAYVEALRALRPGMKVMGNVNHALTDLEYVGLLDAAFDEGTIGKPYSKFENQGIMSVRTRMLQLIANTADGFAVLNAYGSATNYQRVRLGLTMAMLFDAWFCYLIDTGTLRTIWADEFGQPIGVRTGVIPGGPWSNGVWAQTFENGLVLCNPGDTAAVVDPTSIGSFTRFLGTQAPSVNNGAAVSGPITIPAYDGLLLLTVP